MVCCEILYEMLITELQRYSLKQFYEVQNFFAHCMIENDETS